MLIERFCSGNGEEKRKIHWLSSDTLCITKLDGDLGLRDFKALILLS